jgi:hypothetical protein
MPMARCSTPRRRRVPARDVPGEAAGRLIALWRDKQVQYTWLRAAQGRHADFLQVTADDLGYFDQAHFTRDFQQITGATPGRY